MSGVAHLLDASITSALALKPSTVYVLRVENSKTRAAWHLRKCFSEFCELREKVIALIDGTSVTTITTSSSSSTTSSNASTSGSSFDSHSSSGSELSCGSGGESSTTKSSSSTTCWTGSDRFPYLYKQFPRRQLFGSRSKRVIEQRTHALNAFLRQLLLFVREVKQQNQIAVYFSAMNFLEPFFECAAHASSSASVAYNNYRSVTTTTPFNFNTFSLNSPSALARTQAAAAAARAAVAAPLAFHRHRHHPQSPFTYTDDDDEDCSSEDESDCELAAAVGPADIASNKNNFNFARRFYQEYGKTTTTTRDSDSDDEETKLVVGLKKTASCIAHRELKEMRMHFSGSHYAPMQSIDAATTSIITNGGRTNGMSASDAWAARIEIAGFSSATAAASGRSNNSSNAQVQNSSKLAIGTATVRHHPNHSSNKKTSNITEASPVRSQQQRHKYEENEQKTHTQAASIVYASSKPHQPSSSSKAMLFKQKQFHASAAATATGRRVAREERPEWA